MDDVHVRQSTLAGLRNELLSINSRQMAGVDAALADLTRTQLDLEAARRRAEIELARAEAVYQSCREAAADGGPGPDCSGLADGVLMAEERLRRIERAIGEVDEAGEAFQQAAQAHRTYLSHSVDAMRNALHAREVSVEAYLAYRASAGSTANGASATDAARAIAQDRATQQKYGAFRIPNPVEARERHGPERE